MCASGPCLKLLLWKCHSYLWQRSWRCLRNSPARRHSVDNIHLEMLAQDSVRLFWLTDTLSGTWKKETVSVDWQTKVMLPIFKKADQRMCSSVQDIILLILGKAYARLQEKRLWLTDCWTDCWVTWSWKPGCGTVDLLFSFAWPLRVMGVCQSSQHMFCGLGNSI